MLSVLCCSYWADWVARIVDCAPRPTPTWWDIHLTIIMTRWLCSVCLCCVLWALIAWNKSLHHSFIHSFTHSFIHSFIHWRRASIRDVHSTEVYKRYLPHFCSDLKTNKISYLTVEFSEFSYVGRHGWNEFLELEFLWVWRSPIWCSW